ncbi:MerR family transcriptional regulator [Candidatus Thioglobus sp.]|nr:MerR family transcriptional regulator [Candidatus Thioglobus sp.]
MQNNQLFPIRELDSITGVNASTLRAWERRYGLLKPVRTPKGHRLYSQEDIDIVERVKQLLNDGHGFTSIKKIIQSSSNSRSLEDIQDIWQKPIHDIKTAVSDYSYARVDSVFNEISSLYPIEMVSEKFIRPLLEYYRKNDLLIAESGFFNKWLQIRFSDRFQHDNCLSHKAKKIIFSGPPEHEAELMLVSNMIISQGYQAISFGSLLPLHNIASVVEKSAAKALFIMPNQHLIEQLDDFSHLIKTLNIPVFLFGETIATVGAVNDGSQKAHSTLENFTVVDRIIRSTLEPLGVKFLGNNSAVAVNIFRKQMRHQYHE